MFWINSMKAPICIYEPASDSTGAEAMMDWHNLHTPQIDARKNTFQVGK